MSAESLGLLLRSVKLPSFAAHHAEISDQAEREGWSFTAYLRHLTEMELEDRRIRKIERLLKSSHLPKDKTLATLDASRFPVRVQRQLPALCEGHFLKRAENVLAFGLPGRGKTHLLCAIGHELVQKGRSVLFTPAYRLVQALLAAKRDLGLDKELRRLDRFEAVIIDDIGYVQQEREEVEVLFTFLAERYERRSVLITSNLVFSQWDKIFKDPMTTAAAIDRLVHHCAILELTGTSFRTENALATSDTDPPTTKEE
ncbi:IS21-like element helper ATPase IstB [Thermodesulfobacteriota bacterium]